MSHNQIRLHFQDRTLGIGKAIMKCNMSQNQMVTNPIMPVISSELLNSGYFDLDHWPDKGNNTLLSPDIIHMFLFPTI